MPTYVTFPGVVRLSGSVIVTGSPTFTSACCACVELDRDLPDDRRDREHRPGLHRCAERRCHARHPHRARLERHRPEQQLTGRAEAASRLEGADRGPCRRSESLPGKALAVAERVQIPVQLRNIATRRHPGHEGTPRRDRPVQRDDGLAIDLVERLAPVNDLTDRGQLGVGGALAVHGCRRLCLRESRLRARQAGRRRRDRLPISRDLHRRLRHALLVRRHGLRVAWRTASSRSRCRPRPRPRDSRRSHRRCRPHSRPTSFARSADRLAFAWSSVAVSVASVACAVCSCALGRDRRLLRLRKILRHRPRRHDDRRRVGVPQRRAHLRLRRQGPSRHGRERGREPVVHRPAARRCVAAVERAAATTTTTAAATATPAARARTVRRDDRVSSSCDISEWITADRSTHALDDRSAR